ncbi:MAG: HPF/RaiA family ribosome-associated protein [Phycisphaerae bacterium]
MLVEICSRHGPLNPALEDQLVRRLRFALARFGGRIRLIRATLEDLNGPRGGEDQHCRIEVSLVPSCTIMAEATDAEVASAVGRAAERAARRVRDALDRTRTMRTRPHVKPHEEDTPDEGGSL